MINEDYQQSDDAGEEGYSLSTEEQLFVEKIINLLCFISLAFLLFFIYLSLPTYQFIFEYNTEILLLITTTLPLIHLALGTYFLWKKYPIGWYLIFSYIMTSVCFSLMGLISTAFFNFTGESLTDYMTVQPLMFYFVYLGMYAVLLLFLFRKNLRWYLYVERSGIIRWFFYSLILFVFYLLPVYLV
ncbi:MAG: hypothetical protein WBA74_03830 [Cyclobacteriaceae bacterium]